MNEKKTSFVMQGAILAFAGIITKIIGFIYRIPMANMLGEEGNGIYSVAFGIYNVALTLSSYSLPLALSKIISSRVAKGEEKNAYTVFKRALLFATVAGLTAFSVLFFGAEWLEALYGRTGLKYPLLVLAPTTFAVALLGVFRGYFQGHSNMVPTALSQIVEQIINAGVSIFATFMFMKSYGSAPIGAAGATMGTLAGAFGALVMLALFFSSKMAVLKKALNKDLSPAEKRGDTYREILLTMFPIILSQTVFQISFTVDDLLFGNLLIIKGYEESVISSLQGVFNTQYTGLVNLPIAISTALASATLPAIVDLHTKGNTEEKHKKTDAVIKLTMAITIPSAIGLAILARPIMTLLFPSLVTYRETAIALLEFGSLGCVFYALSIITTSVLQGNGRMRAPVLNAFVSFIFHIVLFYSLLKFTDLGVYARLIADLAFPLVIALLNCVTLKEKTGYVMKLKASIVYPLVYAMFMGIATSALYRLILHFTKNMLLSLVLALPFAVTVYGVLLLTSKAFSDEEILDFPLGRTLLRIKKKLKKQ